MRILVIGDTHAPFHHEHTLDFLRDLSRTHKPDAVVHIGDLGDQHGWSRHGRLPDAPGQRDEDEDTVSFCRALYRMFRRVKACVGNHDRRLARACVRAGIPSRLHRTVAEVYDSPAGWEWADEHIIDGIEFEHGEGYSGDDAAVKAARQNGCSTVIGHIHSVAGVRYSCSRRRCIFGASTGCLIDPISYGMAYAQQCSKKPILGAMIIHGRVPCFIPMES